MFKLGLVLNTYVYAVSLNSGLSKADDEGPFLFHM